MGSNGRWLLLLAIIGSTQVLAQSAAAVCANITFSTDKVECLSAINGHTVQPAAATVCGNITFGSDIVKCMRATLDKEYTPDELQACESVTFSTDKVACMEAAGRVPVREVRDDRRRRDRDDDEDGDRRRRRRRDRRDRDDDSDDSVRLKNLSGESITRLYWRHTDSDDWRKEELNRPLVRGFHKDFSLPRGKLSICLETADGYYTVWPKVRVKDELTELSIEGDRDDKSFGRGRCRDQ
jgi:hypothetical protein